MFDVDYLGEEVAVQLTVMKNKVCFSGKGTQKTNWHDFSLSSTILSQSK